MEPITISEQLDEMMLELSAHRAAVAGEAARELSIAITALEDAQMRVNRAGTLMQDGELKPGHRL